MQRPVQASRSRCKKASFDPRLISCANRCNTFLVHRSEEEQAELIEDALSIVRQVKFIASLFRYKTILLENPATGRLVTYPVARRARG